MFANALFISIIFFSLLSIAFPITLDSKALENFSSFSFNTMAAFLPSVISLITPIKNLLLLLSTYRVFLVEIIRVSPPLTVNVSSLTFSIPVKITCLSIFKNISSSSGLIFSANVLPMISLLERLKISQNTSLTIMKRLCSSLTNTGSPILFIMLSR